MSAPLAPPAVRADAAEPPAAYAGMPVAQVRLEAPAGGLPRENLEPLLRVRQGDPLDLGAVREDLSLLYRAGDFTAVEAVVEPWFEVGPDGNPIDAVLLTYRVQASPRLASVRVRGVRGAARKVTLAALDVHRGQPFLVQEDGPALRRRLRVALYDAGWQDADVAVEPATGADGRLSLTIRIAPGVPVRFGKVQVAGTTGFSTRKIRRWLRGAGVAPGRRLSVEALGRAEARLRTRLTDAGWLRARVQAVLGDRSEGAQDVVVAIESGDRLQIRAEGRALPRSRDLRKVLGIQPGDRVDRGMVASASDRLSRWYRDKGYLLARVKVDLETVPGGRVLRVKAERGPLNRLQRIEVQGASAFTPAYLAGAIREAAPDTLARGIPSPDALAHATRAVEDLYRGHGYLAARVRGEFLPGATTKHHQPRAVPVTAVVRVDEGRQTLLASLDAKGFGASGPARQVFEAARERMVGQPYSSAALDALAQKVTDALKADGHLEADVRVRTDLSEERVEARAHLDVSTGEIVRLRSLLMDGNRRTRRQVITREVPLEVGDPITPAALAEARERLYALDLFRVVDMQLVGDDDRFRDLVIKVDERPNVLLELGGDVSTDAGVRLTARMTHRNIAGIGHRLSALCEIGYGWFGDYWRLDTGDPVWRASVRYEAPHLPGPRDWLVVDGLFDETQSEPTWRLSRSGGSVGLRAGLSDGVDAVVDYKVQVRTLDDVEPGAISVGDPWASLEGEARPHRLVGGPELSLYVDKRDDPHEPTEGTVLSAVAEVHDGLWPDASLAGWPVHAVRTSLTAERLQPIGWPILDLVGRLGFGWVPGRGTTLGLEDRFYLGGAATLRGFSLDSVGPANYVDRPDIPYPDQIDPIIEHTALRDRPAHWVVTGGDAMVAGTLELRLPLSVLGERLGGTALAAFADAGHVGFLDRGITTDSITRGADPWVRIGFGMGLRLQTPVGPAALDLGVNPHPLEDREEARLLPHFSLGAL